MAVSFSDRYQQWQREKKSQELAVQAQQEKAAGQDARQTEAKLEQVQEQMQQERAKMAAQDRAQRQRTAAAVAAAEQAAENPAPVGRQNPSMTDEEVAQRQADLQAEINSAQAALDLINTSSQPVDPAIKQRAQQRYDNAVAGMDEFNAMLERDYTDRNQYEYINNIGGAQEKEDKRFNNLIFSSEGDHNDMSRYKYMTPEEVAEYNRLYELSPQRAANYREGLEDTLRQRQGYTMGQGEVVNQYIGEQAADYEEAVRVAELANNDAQYNSLLSQKQKDAAQKAYDDAVAARDAYYAQLEEQQGSMSDLEFVMSMSDQMGDWKPEHDVFQTLDDTVRTAGQSARNAVGAVFDWAGQTVTDPSAADYGSMFIRESYNDEDANFLGTGQSWQELMLGTGDVIGAMIPGWAAGLINPALGYAVQGVTSGASAYRQAKQEGYTDEQANKYGILTGASEAVLSKLLGGLGGKAGVSEDILLPRIAMWDSALKRVAATMGVNIASEEVEEALQNYAVEPLMRRWLEMDYTAPNAQEVLENALLTAVSSVIMSGGQTLQMGVNPGAFADGGLTTPQSADADSSPDKGSQGQQTALEMIEEAAGVQTPSNPAAQQTQQEMQPTTAQTAAESLTQPSGETDDSTIVNDNPAQHTPEEQAQIEAYKAATDESLKEFYLTAANGSASAKGSYDLSPVSNRMATDVQRLLGVDVSGFASQLDAKQAWHINHDHGENGVANRSMSDPNDVARMQFVLDNYETAFVSGQTDAYWEPKGNGKNRQAKTIAFAKKVNGTYFVVEAAPMTKNKTVKVVTAFLLEEGKTPPGKLGKVWLEEIKKQKETNSPEMQIAPPPTSEAATVVGPSANTNIAQPDGGVNGELPEGMGAASAGFSSRFSQWQEQTPEGGFHPVNEAAAQRTMETRGRAVSEVPKKNIAGRLTSKTASTLINAGMTTNEFAAQLETRLANGGFSRMVYTDAEAQANAETWIRDRGYEQAKTDWLAEVKAGKMSKDITAQGIALYNNAVNGGDALDALNIATAMINYAKELGRAQQALNLINKLGPAAELYQLSMSVEMWTEKLKKKLGDKAADLVIKPELAKNFSEAKTEEDRGAAYQTLIQDIADQMPGSWPEKFEAWRYMSMLGNARTHIRNIAGNAGFAPVRAVKNIMATALETTVDAVSGGKLTESGGRTKAFLNYADANDRALVQAAAADFVQVEDAIQGGGKYDQMTGDIDKLRRIYKNGVLEWVRKTNSNLLDAEDVLFSKPAYAKALASYLKANNVTAAQFMEASKAGSSATEDVTIKIPLKVGDSVKAADRNNYGEIIKDNGDGTFQVRFKNKKGAVAVRTFDGNMLKQKGASKSKTTLHGKQDTMNAMVLKAREYAIKEAQKATYRDANWMSEKLSGMRVKGDDVGTKIANAVFVEGVLPFKKTPANVLMRGIEYSPLGIVRDVANLTFRVRNGKATASEAIDNFCQTMTGTALTAAGYFLASQMLVTGGLGDDEEDKFRMMRGEQGYALVIGDKSYTIDWLAPAALPFFVGVELYNGGTPKEAFTRLTQPLLELSMLQSLNDAIDRVSYAENKVWTIISAGATSYLLQFMPTIGGQIERTFLEDTRQTFYRDRDSEVDGDLQYLLYQGLNKLPLPGAEYNSIDYIDAWGRTESTGSMGERFLENFISPGYLSEDRSTPIDDELQRLYDAGYVNVLPKRAATDTQVSWQEDGETEKRNLTSRQYERYATIRGRTAYDILSDAVGSDIWDDMNDEQRAAYIDKVYTYANETAKNKVERRDTVPEWMSAQPRGMSDMDWIYMVATYGSSAAVNHYSDLAKSGLDMDEAGQVFTAIAQTNAAANARGKSAKDIEYVQSISEISGMSDKDKVAATTEYTSDSMAKRYTTAINAGFTFDEWTDIMSSLAQWPAPTEKHPDRTAGTDPAMKYVKEWAAQTYPNDPDKQRRIIAVYEKLNDN